MCPGQGRGRGRGRGRPGPVLAGPGAGQLAWSGRQNRRLLWA